MNKETRGVVLCGVGGQGVVLLSNIFTEALVEMGYDVKKTEQHGMSQRNGSVNAQIKFGQRVYAPVVAMGAGDMIVAFEKAEALRWIPFLKEGGWLVVNDYEIDPVSVQLGDESYPEGLDEKLTAAIPNTVIVDAQAVGEACGTIKAQSMVLLGIMVKKLVLEHYDWESKIRSMVPPAYAEANVLAYRRGLEL